ncbi:spore germination protein [Ectobacillus panaciterrae]|uniref:spore germination protein n=1 Tax=Ectobacillus panaciterrae TaxID=363872 RepID=UPI0003FA94C6|nr:spore germination protein [Ectobacillus panaciterrae]
MGFFKTDMKRLSSKTTKQKTSQQENQLKINLKENLAYIHETLGKSSDIVTREFRIGRQGHIQAAVLYTDGLTDTDAIHNFIMESLMLDIQGTALEQELSGQQDVLHTIQEVILTVGEIQEVSDWNQLYDDLLSGNAILLINGSSACLSLGTKKWKERGVTEPEAESVVRGPREGFSENLRVNTALVRRKINDRNLWLESKKIGKVTKTQLAIMYLKGIANEKIVGEVKSRLDRIDTDSVLESGMIEELIQDKTFTPFPTVYTTERPDVVAAQILEGRVAILLDGTPFVLITPASFVQFFQSPEDYSNRSDISTLIRLLRYMAFFLTLLAPSLYIAVTTFHQEMIPTPLLISLAAQREGVPFPAFIEAIVMEVTFEILREAGVRMPRAVGQAVSIVGALVLGTAAVDAGIVSAAMVIVVAITAISSFVLPNYSMATSIRLLRFPLMGLAASFGLFGISAGMTVLTLHLCSLRSFGVPYMVPFAPFIPSDQKDAVFRVPKWAMFTRPRLISQQNVEREKTPPPKPDPLSEE